MTLRRGRLDGLAMLPLESVILLTWMLCGRPMPTEGGRSLDRICVSVTLDDVAVIADVGLEFSVQITPGRHFVETGYLSMTAFRVGTALFPLLPNDCFSARLWDDIQLPIWLLRWKPVDKSLARYKPGPNKAQ